MIVCSCNVLSDQDVDQPGLWLSRLQRWVPAPLGVLTLVEEL